jgi:regulatory protein
MMDSGGRGGRRDRYSRRPDNAPLPESSDPSGPSNRSVPSVPAGSSGSSDTSDPSDPSIPSGGSGFSRKPAAAGPERRGPSLKARAVGFLSRREYARTELARKLGQHTDDAEAIEALLDDLEREGWLSTRRFAESLVHRRAERQGTARIVQELRQHGVDENQIGELKETLRASEYDRALAVWAKRFGDERPTDRAVYARQARFLAARGFSHDVIRRVLGGDPDD